MKIEEVARRYGVVLLYHYVSTTTPSALSGTLHSVTPQMLARHLDDLSGYFEFVSLGEFAEAKSKQGLAAITFDDGYRNVLTEALPLLEAMNYPATLFINPLTFERRYNWRDKVRYLIHYHRVSEFVKANQPVYQSGRFYRYSKNPLNSSLEMDRALDEFLADKVVDIYGEYPYLTANNIVTDCRLVDYGNHSQNHYVLASLEDETQKNEIETAAENLQNIPAIALNNCFSAPFGGTEDINAFTCQWVNQMGYAGLLMSRQRLQAGKAETAGLQVLERFMPRTENIIDELLLAFEKAIN